MALATQQSLKYVINFFSIIWSLEILFLKKCHFESELFVTLNMSWGQKTSEWPKKCQKFSLFRGSFKNFFPELKRPLWWNSKSHQMPQSGLQKPNYWFSGLSRKITIKFLNFLNWSHFSVRKRASKSQDRLRTGVTTA